MTTVGDSASDGVRRSSNVVRATLDGLPDELLSIIVDNVLQDRPTTRVPRRYVNMFERRARRRQWHMPVHSIAQTCRVLRRVTLPAMWNTLTWDDVGDVKHFDRFMGSVAKARETYGEHVQMLSFSWTWLERQEYFSEKLVQDAFQQHVELEDPFNHDNYDYHPVFEAPEDLYDALGRLVAYMPNLVRLDWRVTPIPLCSRLASCIEESCKQIETVSFLKRTLQPQNTSRIEASIVPCIDKGLKHLVIIGARTSENPSGLLTDVPSWLERDESCPFHIRVRSPKSPESTIFHEQIDTRWNWTVYNCWLGAQHGLRSVLFPSLKLFHLAPLIPLWLVLSFEGPSHEPYRRGPPFSTIYKFSLDHEAYYDTQSWAKGFTFVRRALLSLLIIDNTADDAVPCLPHDWLEQAAVRVCAMDSVVASVPANVLRVQQSQKPFRISTAVWDTLNIQPLSHSNFTMHNLLVMAAFRAFTILDTIRNDPLLHRAVERSLPLYTTTKDNV